jgi:hypothetical protein
MRRSTAVGFDEDCHMGFRFQKRISILPGVRINLSKGGVSTSLGGHGATVNLGTKRRTVTLGIPGTGMSYQLPVTGTIIVALVIAAAVIGVAYLVRPDLVIAGLHWWQPKLF